MEDVRASRSRLMSQVRGARDSTTRIVIDCSGTEHREGRFGRTYRVASRVRAAGSLLRRTRSGGWSSRPPDPDYANDVRRLARQNEQDEQSDAPDPTDRRRRDRAAALRRPSTSPALRSRRRGGGRRAPRRARRRSPPARSSARPGAAIPRRIPHARIRLRNIDDRARRRRHGDQQRRDASASTTSSRARTSSSCWRRTTRCSPPATCSR